MGRLAHGGLWIVLLVLGLMPFVGYSDAVPTQPDSIKWIENADLESKDWKEWTFHSSHFVGYRPLTALSFTADLEAFGPSATALRWTDLGLHLLAGLAVGLLALRLVGPKAGSAAGSTAGALALAWFLLHPGTEEVLPFLARRSYSLAVLCAFLGFLSCVTAVRSARAPLRWLTGALVGPLLMAALFANELGAVIGLALPVMAFAAGGASDDRKAAWRRTAAVTAWGWSCLAVGVWIRSQVLQGDSGYEVQVKEPGRTGEILGLYALAATGELRDASTLRTIAASALGLYFLVMAALQGRGRGLRLPLGLLGVLAAYGVVIAREAVWFPRQVYPATALVALVVGVVAARAFHAAPSEGRRLPKAVHAIPLIGLFALALVHSPVVRGTTPVRQQRAEVATRFCTDLLEDTANLEAPADGRTVVQIIVPTIDHAQADAEAAARAPLAAVRAKGSDSSAGPSAGRTTLRIPIRWLRFVTRAQQWTIQDVLYVTDPMEEHAPTLVPGQPATLQLPEGVPCMTVKGRRVTDWPMGQRRFRIAPPKSADANRHVWIYGPDGGISAVPR